MAVVPSVYAQHWRAREAFDLRPHREISRSVDVRDEVDEVVLEPHPARRPEQGDQRDAMAELVRQARDHERRDVRASRVSDHHDSIPPPCRGIVSDDPCQVARTLVRRAAPSEIDRRIEPHDGNAVCRERSGEPPVRDGPPTIARDEDGERRIRPRRGNLNQREIGNVAAAVSAVLNVARRRAERGGNHEQDGSHLTITPRKPPEIRAARLSSTRGTASPPGQATYFGSHTGSNFPLY